MGHYGAKRALPCAKIIPVKWVPIITRGYNDVFYREAGQFKTTYAADQAVFPINLDRWFIAAALVVAFVVIPMTANEYWLQAVLIPILVFTMAAIGLNLLVGYAGQLSLGTGGFMAVGGFMTYKITTAFPELNIILVFLMSSVI